MDFWSWVELAIVALLFLLAWAAYQSAKDWVKKKLGEIARKVRSKLDSFGKMARWVGAHPVGFAAATTAVGGAAVAMYLWAPLLVSTPAATATASTVSSSWVSAGAAGANAARASVGIALSVAAARGNAAGVVWQNWMTPRGAADVAQQLKPGQSYDFNLALTPGNVEKVGAKVTVASAESQEVVRAALTSKQPVELSAVFLADPKHLALEPGESPRKRLVVDVPRLLDDARNPPSVAPSSIDVAIERAFAHVSFKVRAGTVNGWTKASVLLMAKNRAIDQVITTQCVGECPEPMPTGRVPAATRLYALMEDAAPPDVSLFLTELEPNQLHGVLVSLAPVDGQNAWVWNTQRTKEDFANLLATTITRRYQDINSRDELLGRGETIANLVFPESGEGDHARAALRQLMIASSKWLFGDGNIPKTLFVHFDFPGISDAPTIVPIGLMALQGADGKPDFVGRHFMVEQMMKLPRYGAARDCVGNWALLLPDVAAANDALKLAHQALQNLKTTWPPKERLQEFNDIERFGAWLKEKEPSDTPMVITTLSHHDANLLYFRDKGPSIASPDVRRTFAPSSVAILDGCGTGQPGAMDFVVQFNQRGVHSAIVTAFNVNGAIAGTYLACMRQALARGRMPLGAAHFQAVNACKWQDDQAPDASSAARPPKLLRETYAANALKYVLIGDPSTPICP